MGLLSATEALPIVTGNTIVHDLAVRIGGDRVAASCLLAPGIDPHTYQPVPEDARRIARARLVIINGLGFEGWFDALAREAGFAGSTVIASAGIEPLTIAGEGVVDPHAFNSIVNGVRYAENIRDALLVADPAGGEVYRARAAEVIAELRAADAWAKEQFATIPPAQRRIVTNHDALQYFAREYRFVILAPSTALEDSQPSAQSLAALVEEIRGQQVKGVFLEYGKSQKVVEQLAREAGIRIGGELYLDGVGPAGSAAATYVGSFRANVATIQAALR